MRLRSLSLGLLAGAVSLAAAPAPDFIIIANINRNYVIGSKIVTLNGLYQRDAAGAWRHFGSNDTSLSAVAFDPRDHNVIYTAALNGLWRSLDGGQSWRMCNDWSLTEARDVAVDPNAPDTVYLAVTDGVAVSTDRAQTLVRRENGLPGRGKYTQAIEIDRTRAGRVLAGCETGIYLTEDAAQHWRRVFAATDTVNDLQQSPHDPRVWLAATQSAGALISRDGGVTWAAFPGVPAEHALYNITFDPANPQRLAIGSWAHGVLTSEDSGATWVARNAGLPGAHRVWRVGADAAGRLYASVFGETLYVSDDFGRTWQPDALAGSLVNQFLLLPKAAN